MVTFETIYLKIYRTDFHEFFRIRRNMVEIHVINPTFFFPIAQGTFLW